ncbi:hypothetical protein BO94DRAFT_579071 [Aspergillus sclerotioniger CBS 115572]|uniref:Uncharacterized protein n=1 Tax=Aspergillus sclerotioniger CBS 115572 TaxID=1450535 RepID=A0A317VAA2_9EURO|nr:hypothetical protein BO94DRAFT_579071 [Aspergillus sclerotioniger CBS 115572]PWY69832.1 hypothetical protein BO94DRAFT_579071 [Aspergillus sclerotioniger CBS 115572]
MATSQAETDMILNKANVALARSQRLVASWLPAPVADDRTHVKSEEELQREEDEIFKAVPETAQSRLGVGAPLPTKAADGSWNRTELESNDKLRKQLLGRNYKKVMVATSAAKAGTTSAGAGAGGRQDTSSGIARGMQEEDVDDEEEGRTSLIGKKNFTVAKKRKAESQAQPEFETVNNQGSEPKQTNDSGDGSDDKVDQSNKQTRPAPRPSKGRRKATSFLDELLAERAKKRKKR